MPPLVHWDDVEGRRRDAGHLGGTWYDLGSAAGSVNVGVKRIQVDPGRWSTPAHVEGAEEEIFFVLSGSGISWQLVDGEASAYEVRAGDCIVHLPESAAHTLRAGPDGLDVLAYGERRPHGNTVLPRAGVAWVWPAFADVTMISGFETHPYRREADAGEPDAVELSARPPSIVNLEDVEREPFGRGRFVRSVERDLASAAGSERTGLNWRDVAPGMLMTPAHCHSADEELFVVADGEGHLVLGEDEYPVRRGHVVARPAGTRVAHALRAGGDGMAVLSYGTREPNDIAYYPRSNKINWRGVGVIGRIERVDYWDGET